MVLSPPIKENDDLTKMRAVIEKYPGLTINKLVELSQVTLGTAKHHLPHTKRIEVLMDGGNKRYFIAGRFNTTQKNQICTLYNKGARDTYAYLEEFPGSHVDSIKDGIDVSASYVYASLEKLSSAKLTSKILTSRYIPRPLDFEFRYWEIG